MGLCFFVCLFCWLGGLCGLGWLGWWLSRSAVGLCGCLFVVAVCWRVRLFVCLIDCYRLFVCLLVCQFVGVLACLFGWLGVCLVVWLLGCLFGCLTVVCCCLRVYCVVGWLFDVLVICVCVCVLVGFACLFVVLLTVI